MRLQITMGLLLLAVALSAQTPQTQSQTQTAPQDEPPPATDIYLLAWPPAPTSVGRIQDITSRSGYDNQPMFSPDGNRIFFTSIGDDEQADIYAYSVKQRNTVRITNTKESEYSPTFMPDRSHLSVVRVEKDKESTQRLWKFPLSGGPPSLILRDVKPVGYHCWIDSHRVALFILGEPNTLQIADTNTGTAQKVADDIGRSLHKISGSSNISFTVKHDKSWVIQEYNPDTGNISKIVDAVGDSEDYVWTKDGKILMGNGTKLFQWDRKNSSNDWKEIADLSSAGIGKITRLALNADDTFLAFVAEEKP